MDIEKCDKCNKALRIDKGEDFFVEFENCGFVYCENCWLEYVRKIRSETRKTWNVLQLTNTLKHEQ